MTLSFDIETKPLPDAELLPLLPEFDDSKFQPSTFDPESVKMGNLKDPDKRAAKLEQARKVHEVTQQGLADAEKIAREEHLEKFKLDGLTDAVFSNICAIGFYSDRGGFDYYYPEKDTPKSHTSVIRATWATLEACLKQNQSIICVNGMLFDLPYLINKSWMLGVSVPPIIAHDFFGRWPKYDHRILDMRQAWLCGRSWANTKSSFDHMGLAFGSGGKDVEGCDGKDFHKIWESDRKLALQYLENDVRQPLEWAQTIMGIV